MFFLCDVCVLVSDLVSNMYVWLCRLKACGGKSKTEYYASINRRAEGNQCCLIISYNQCVYVCV